MSRGDSALSSWSRYISIKIKPVLNELLFINSAYNTHLKEYPKHWMRIKVHSDFKLNAFFRLG